MQANQPPRPLHDLRIMGGINESRAVSAIELFHHFEESGRRHRVEIRRGLVRQDQRRLGDHGSRHRHPLLLPAGQLAGTTMFKAGKADFCEQLLHSFFSLLHRHALQEQGEFSVLQGGQDRQQVVRLEDEAEALQPQASQFP